MSLDATPAEYAALADAFVYFFAVGLPLCLLTLAVWGLWEWWLEQSPVRQARRAVAPPRSHCRRIPKQPKPFDQLSEEQT